MRMLIFMCTPYFLGDRDLGDRLLIYLRQNVVSLTTVFWAQRILIS